MKSFASFSVFRLLSLLRSNLLYKFTKKSQIKKKKGEFFLDEKRFINFLFYIKCVSLITNKLNVCEVIFMRVCIMSYV